MVCQMMSSSTPHFVCMLSGMCIAPLGSSEYVCVVFVWGWGTECCQSCTSGDPVVETGGRGFPPPVGSGVSVLVSTKVHWRAAPPLGAWATAAFCWQGAARSRDFPGAPETTNGVQNGIALYFSLPCWLEMFLYKPLSCLARFMYRLFALSLLSVESLHRRASKVGHRFCGALLPVGTR